MPVRSLLTVLNDFAVAHMQVVVPEDVEVIVGVTPTYEMSVANGVLEQEAVARVDLYVEWDVRAPGERTHPSTGKIRTVSLSINLPLWWVKDGDTGPLAEKLDALWDQAQFMMLAAEALPGLHEVLDEEGGWPGEDDEEQYAVEYDGDDEDDCG